LLMHARQVFVIDFSERGPICIKRYLGKILFWDFVEPVYYSSTHVDKLEPRISFFWNAKWIVKAFYQRIDDTRFVKERVSKKTSKIDVIELSVSKPDSTKVSCAKMYPTDLWIEYFIVTEIYTPNSRVRKRICYRVSCLGKFPNAGRVSRRRTGKSNIREDR